MSQNDLNPNNSSIIQILLDLHAISSQSNDIEILELCAKLKTKLDDRYLLQKQVDEKFNGRKYNEKNITFSKLENFKNLKIINNLSANAMKILFLIIQVVSQDNLIEIRIATFSDVLNMSKPTIKKCLLELEESGVVSKIQNRNKTQGTIYMLNPKIAFSGKKKHSKIFKEITHQSSLSKFEKLNKNNYNIVSSKGFVSVNENENKYLTFNSLEDNSPVTF